MAIVIWVDGPVCIGKTETSQALLRRLAGYSSIYLDSDEYYEIYKKTHWELLLKKQDEPKKGESELFKIAAPSFINNDFIIYFKTIIQEAIQANSITIVAMSLGTEQAKTLLFDPISKITNVFHVVLYLDKMAHLQRIKNSGRDNISFARNWREKLYDFAEKHYPSSIWIKIDGKIPEEIADEFLERSSFFGKLNHK